jgi:hypothetical protein
MDVVTQQELRETLSYDEISGEFRWNVSVGRRVRVGDVAGYLSSRGYLRIQIKGKLYLAHRLAWIYVHGSFPEGQIDHISGDCSDNRICNLRAVSCRENQCNQKLHREGRLPGCSYDKRAKKWQARICINGKKVHLGLFHTEQEAHEAYIKAKEIYDHNS